MICPHSPRWRLAGALLTYPPCIALTVAGLAALAVGATTAATWLLIGAIVAITWWPVTDWLLRAAPYYRYLLGTGDDPEARTGETQRLN
jgi:hypothetical protein